LADIDSQRGKKKREEQNWKNKWKTIGEYETKKKKMQIELSRPIQPALRKGKKFQATRERLAWCGLLRVHKPTPGYGRAIYKYGALARILLFSPRTFAQGDLSPPHSPRVQALCRIILLNLTGKRDLHREDSVQSKASSSVGLAHSRDQTEMLWTSSARKGLLNVHRLFG
jgi:hypothetical protein